MAPEAPAVSDSAHFNEALLRSANQGDWNGMASVLDELAALPAPQTSAALHDRARLLEEALTTAKTTRADLAVSLVRLHAAAKFSRCQNFGDSTRS